MKKMICFLSVLLALISIPIQASANESEGDGECDHVWVEVTDSPFAQHEKQATCTETGITTMYCAKCDLYSLEKTPKHHTFGDEVEVPSSCNEIGYTAKICSQCGEFDFTNIVPAVHDDKMALTQEYREAGYFRQGVLRYICPICKNVISEITDPSYWETNRTMVLTKIVLIALIVGVTIWLTILLNKEMKKRKEENWYEKDIYNAGAGSNSGSK